MPRLDYLFNEGMVLREKNPLELKETVMLKLRERAKKAARASKKYFVLYVRELGISAALVVFATVVGFMVRNAPCSPDEGSMSLSQIAHDGKMIFTILIACALLTLVISFFGGYVLRNKNKKRTPRNNTRADPIDTPSTRKEALGRLFGFITSAPWGWIGFWFFIELACLAIVDVVLGYFLLSYPWGIGVIGIGGWFQMWAQATCVSDDQLSFVRSSWSGIGLVVLMGYALYCGIIEAPKRKG